MRGDPKNPFSSNYDGTPVGPDSFGGSDFPEVVEEKFGECASTEQMHGEMMARLYDSSAIAQNIVDYLGKKESDRVASHSMYFDDLDPSGWIQLYSGKKFFPLRPEVEDIDIEDIAHSLSNMCRFTGHCKSFYSVAQHSVSVSYLCGEQYALWGLLHDASEAYLVDLPKPVKRLSNFSNFKEIENMIQKVICTKFGLQAEEPAAVKRADTQMLATEARDLMAPLHPEWRQPCSPLPFKIEALSPSEAKKLFLDRYNELIGNHGK